MPLLHIHLAANVILLIGIHLFDSDFARVDKRLGMLAAAVFGSNFIDLDHLFSNPMYDPLRCSINSHVLHSWYMLPVYVLGMLWKNKMVRYFFLAVLLHLWLDWLDCLFFLY